MAYIVKQYNHGEYQGTIGDFFLKSEAEALAYDENKRDLFCDYIVSATD